MMRGILCMLILVVSVSADAVPRPEKVSRIAFGSCLKTDRPQPIWNVVRDWKPDMVLLVGDNVYADTTVMPVMRSEYDMQASMSGFRELRSEVFIDGVWDDHDYGRNDSGRDYPAKVGSQKEYARFFKLPEDSPRRNREGIYDSYTIGPEGQRVQIILLDTRYFRSPLKQGFRLFRKSGKYVAQRGRNVTLLGAAQWKWFEEALKQPAELRVIVSSIQVVAEEHQWERWATFPDERKRLYNLIRKQNADGVIFISGDRHHYELSRDERGPYPLYDLTSSGINEHRANNKTEPNRRRIGKLGRGPNVGLVDIDWQSGSIELGLMDDRGERLLSHKVQLDELRAE